MPATHDKLIARLRDAAHDSMVCADRPLNPHELFGNAADELEAIAQQRDELLRVCEGMLRVADRLWQDDPPEIQRIRSLLDSWAE